MLIKLVKMPLFYIYLYFYLLTYIHNKLLKLDFTSYCICIFKFESFSILLTLCSFSLTFILHKHALFAYSCSQSTLISVNSQTIIEAPGWKYKPVHNDLYLVKVEQSDFTLCLSRQADSSLKLNIQQSCSFSPGQTNNRSKGPCHLKLCSPHPVQLCSQLLFNMKCKKAIDFSQSRHHI